MYTAELLLANAAQPEGALTFKNTPKTPGLVKLNEGEIAEDVSPLLVDHS